ncbi:uncharacterized protein LOC141630637 [Silene latifolia]|uniref:uncharacterized protein LOC141630637 n=1 Tax=Silene latifolia TaxID=37657 RepID=UPI003D7733B1
MVPRIEIFQDCYYIPEDVQAVVPEKNDSTPIKDGRALVLLFREERKGVTPSEDLVNMILRSDRFDPSTLITDVDPKRTISLWRKTVKWTDNRGLLFKLTTVEGEMFKLDDGSKSESECDKCLKFESKKSDVFAWSYKGMPGIDREIVEHRIPIKPGFKPVKQKLCRMRSELSLKVKEEIDKQLKVGFIKVSEYSHWVANVVPLPKKDVWATKKLRQYMLSYSMSVYSKMDPIKYLFKKQVLNGRMSRWTLMLSAFDLKYVPLKVIKGRAVADFLADNPIEETEFVDTLPFPDEDVVHVKNNVWDLYFDEASNYMGYVVGILLISPTGEHVPVSIKLDFNVTNNAAEYEACLLSLRSALDLGVKKLLVNGDSSFVINQDIRYVHLSREENQFADALSNQAALVNIPDHIDSMPICVKRRSSPAYVNTIDNAEEGETEPWFTAILKFKEKEEYPLDLDTRGKRALRMLFAQFIKTDDGQLYKKMAQGVLLRCIDKPTAKKFWRKSMTALSQLSDIRKCAACGTFYVTHHDVTMAIFNLGNRHHWKSKPIRNWRTNGAVEAANKTVIAILRKMSNNYREWPEKIHFALWGYRTSIRTATGATPYYLLYGMEAVQPVELEVPSLRIILESQKRIERAFNKKVKPRGISEGDLVLKSVRALLPIDPRGKFKLNWAGPYLVKKILSGGAIRLTDFHGNDFTNPPNSDQLKKFYP